MECGRHSLCSADPLVASAHFVAHERRRVDRRRAPRAAVFGGNGSGTFLGEIRGGTQHGTANKNVPEDAPHAQICRVFPVRPFSMIAAMLTANPSAKAESYA